MAYLYLKGDESLEKDEIHLSATIPIEYGGMRLDVVLAKLFPEYSRERLKLWVTKGECLVNGNIWKPKEKVAGEEEIVINAIKEKSVSWKPEKINIDIEYVYEDEDILIVNKPTNLVVHPGAGNYSGTLVNILLERFPFLEKIPRAGIVHRLDKDTTGLMVVVKTLRAHTSIVAQLQARKIKRTYDAIVWGVKPAGGTINMPVARHVKDRKKMAVVNEDVEFRESKEAITHYRIEEKFRNNMHLKVNLETGRTHQIRVHMAHIHHPLVGDRVYGRSRSLAKASEELNDFLKNFPRQALHASKLEFEHPVLKKNMQWSINLPQDMQELLLMLREDFKSFI